MAVASERAGTVLVWGGGAGGERGEVDGEAGTEGHWTAVRERRRALANVALNMPEASGIGKYETEDIRDGKGNFKIACSLITVTAMCQVCHKVAANTWKMSKPCGSLLLSTHFSFEYLTFSMVEP